MKDVTTRQLLLLLIPAGIALGVYGSVPIILKDNDYNIWIGIIAAITLYFIDYNFIALKAKGRITYVRYSLIIISISVTALISGEFIFSNEIHEHNKAIAQEKYDEKLNELTWDYKLAVGRAEVEAAGRDSLRVRYKNKTETVYGSGEPTCGPLCKERIVEKQDANLRLKTHEAKGIIIPKSGLAENVGVLYSLIKKNFGNAISIIFITLGVGLLELFPLIAKNYKTGSEIRKEEEYLEEQARLRQKKKIDKSRKALEIMKKDENK